MSETRLDLDAIHARRGAAMQAVYEMRDGASLDADRDIDALLTECARLKEELSDARLDREAARQKAHDLGAEVARLKGELAEAQERHAKERDSAFALAELWATAKADLAHLRESHARLLRVLVEAAVPLEALNMGVKWELANTPRADLDALVRATAGFTPGPWVADDSGAIFDAKGQPIQTCGDYAAKYAYGSEEAASNARLIAAAPALLAYAVRLRAERDEARLDLECREATLHMAVSRLGGTVEGHPTSRINFLQRVDELRRIEADLARLREAAIHFVSPFSCEYGEAGDECIDRMRAGTLGDEEVCDACKMRTAIAAAEKGGQG